MALRVEEYVLKGNEFVRRVAQQLPNPEDTEQAGRVIISVLHTLRDVLTPDESLHLIARLPLYIKAMYIDGWDIEKDREKIGSMQHFLDCLRSQNGCAAQSDFATDEAGRTYVRAVFNVLRKYINEGEMQQVINRLPPDFKF